MKMAGIAAQQASLSNMSENVIYTPGMEKDIQRKLILKAELHKALQSGELKTVYQPKVCAKTRKIKGVEALLRWEHPSLGFISPAEFIPLAEESGLILNIGEYVLEQACKQASKWKKAGGVNPTIAVNVSGHQFNQREIADKLFVLLDFYELSPSDIELEITESVILEQQIVIDILESIRARGIKIAIDDFGTGYSSLSMLKTFPVDILKIDRAFVKDISDSPEARNIADAIVALGHALNLTLVAEGIETEEQLNYFCDRKCHLIQGYLTGKPMSANEIQEQYLM
jgi:EAL domain-containing protein (putative c-di-GMP-specific phosphodiesterase class I)